MNKKIVLPSTLLALTCGAALSLLLLRSEEAPVSPLSRFDARCERLVIVPSSGRLGERVSAMSRLKVARAALDMTRRTTPEKFFQELAEALGADARSPDALRRAGIDPDRPLYAFEPRAGVYLAAVPTSDKAALEALVERHARARLSAAERGEERLEGRKALTFRSVKSDDSAPALTAVFEGGYLYAALGEEGRKALREAFSLQPENALERDADFQARLQSLGSIELAAFQCARADSPDASTLLTRGGALGVSIAEGAVEVRARLPIDRALAGRLSKAEPAPAARIAALDPGAQLFAQIGFDPSAVKPLLPAIVERLPRKLQRALAQANFNPEKVLERLSPGAALSVRLSPKANFMALMGGSLRRVNPFQIVRLEAVGEVTHATEARALLDALADLAPGFGARVERFDPENPAEPADPASPGAPQSLPTKGAAPEPPDDGVLRWTFHYYLGEGATLALRGQQLLATGGEGALPELLERLQKPGAAPRHDLGAAPFVAHLDLGALWSEIRARPDSTYGIGGFAVKAALDRWIGFVDELTSLRVQGSAEGDLLRLDLRLSMAAKSGGAP